ncbi:MAG: YbaB/EbfC family nucleoid-associated protein [Elusimicrobia bacterium]|nr:YbaB/EbfC family nucleoid-associated protein [Elusimicrobiota bacterium]
MFDKLKQMMELKSKMEALKRELDATEVEAQSRDKTVRVKLSASLELRGVSISADMPEQMRAALEKAVAEALSTAVADARKAAAGKMGALTGLGLPGGLS